MAALKEHPAPAEPQSYIWSFPGAPVRIHLALDVVGRLAPRFSGKDGAAQFGLLLGHVDGLTRSVTGFQPLAAAETAEIKPALAKFAAPTSRTSVVGYYRAQQQDGLRLDERDLARAEAFFHNPSNVILLVQAGSTGPANATFFFWDAGKLNGDFPFLEFPFDPQLLAAAEQHRVEAAQRRAFEVLPPPAPAAAKPRRRPFWKAAAWVLLAACVGGGAAIGVRLALEKLRAGSPAASPAAAPAAAAAVPAPQPAMGLHAERQNGDLKLTWNRESAVIAQAASAVLSIEDGASRRTIPLQAGQVRAGSILYTPVSDQVQMELAVSTPAGNTAESVLVLLPKVGPAQTVAMRPPVRVQAAQDESASRSQPPKPFIPPPATPRGSAPATPLVEPPPLTAGANSTALAATPSWSRPAFTLPPPSAPAPASAVPTPAPQRTPAVAPPYRQPEPIFQVRPAFPAALRNTMIQPTAIEVTVAIDETGKVVKAEPKLQPGMNPVIIATAVAAAKQWKFRPARRGDQAVASEMLIRFNFNPVR